MNSKNKICDLLDISHPIIQAPMAGGITTPELISVAANAGILGSFATGYLRPEEIQNGIRKIRAITDKNFSVNVFIPEKHRATNNQIKQASLEIENAARELSIKIELPSPPYAHSFDEQMNVIIEENISVLSFTFGLLDPYWIEKLKNKNVRLIGTATNLNEAKLLEQSGVDIIVAQGVEAGGHRGTFSGTVENSLISLSDLVSQLVHEIKIPIVAAGGIMNREHIKSAMQFGASGVQMGTAFLTCFESGADAVYKKMLLSQARDQTVLTRVFSGKYARAIDNKFIHRMKDKNILDYPIQNALTNQVRKIAKEKGDPDFMSLWAGVGASYCAEISAIELIKKLVAYF